MATVVNLKRDKFDIYIGRAGYGREGSIFANNFVIGRDGTREQVIEKYEADLRIRLSRNPALVTTLLALEGKVLGCFCKPHACHGDILVKLISEYKTAR